MHHNTKVGVRLGQFEVRVFHGMASISFISNMVHGKLTLHYGKYASIYDTMFYSPDNTM